MASFFACCRQPCQSLPNSPAATASRSLTLHLQRLFERHPDLKGLITRVLDDGAADDAELKAAIQEDLGIDVFSADQSAPSRPDSRRPAARPRPPDAAGHAGVSGRISL